MAIWNNFGKKTSEATEKAVQRAKTISEVSRMNTLITEENKNIDGIYLQIGKLYASMHHDEYEEAFGELMNALITAEQKIATYQQQIQVAKGVVRCGGCGAEIPIESAFCSVCGTPVPRKKKAETNCCGNCGAVLAEGVRFCTSCGSPVGQQLPEAEPAAESVATPSRCCVVCGSELEEDALFCSECGSKVS